MWRERDIYNERERESESEREGESERERERARERVKVGEGGKNGAIVMEYICTHRIGCGQMVVGFVPRTPNVCRLR